MFRSWLLSGPQTLEAHIEKRREARAEVDSESAGTSSVLKISEDRQKYAGKVLSARNGLGEAGVQRESTLGSTLRG